MSSTPPPRPSSPHPLHSAGRHPGRGSRNGSGRGVGGRVGVILILVAVLALAYRFLPGTSATAARDDRPKAEAEPGDAGSATLDPALERRFTLPANGALTVSLDAGDVEIDVGSGREAVVALTLSDAAKGDPSRVTWEAKETPQGAEVSLRSNRGDGKDGGGMWSLFGRSTTAAIDSVHLTLPEDASLTLRTGAGDVSAKALGGSFALHSGAGDVEVAGVHGSVEIKTGAGDVEVAADGEARIDTGAGDVSLVAARGPVSVHTGAGDVELQVLSLGGPVEVQTGVGSIDVLLPPGAGAHLNGKSGLGAVSIDAGGVSQRSEGMSGRIEREVGGGGPNVTLATGAGGVVVREGGGAS